MRNGFLIERLTQMRHRLLIVLAVMKNIVVVHLDAKPGCHRLRANQVLGARAERRHLGVDHGPQLQNRRIYRRSRLNKMGVPRHALANSEAAFACAAVSPFALAVASMP